MLTQFQREALGDVINEDALWIMAAGLGCDRVMMSFLEIHCVPESLVLVINTSSNQEETFVNELRLASVPHQPLSVTTATAPTDRTQTYERGGVLFMSSRLLVVDLLKKRLPSNVSGVVVWSAERVSETSMEAFILRLFHEQHPDAFIKAFSENADSFISGFMKIEKLLKRLHVSHLRLWPRFHLVVGTSLPTTLEVVEIAVPLSATMARVQTAVLQIMEACLQEVRRAHPSIDATEFTIESGLFASFDTVLKSQLAPIWHSVSSKTQQLVGDLRSLRILLQHLTNYDCVTFNGFLETLRTSSRAYNEFSPWLLLDAADHLFANARDRVYVMEKLVPHASSNGAKRPKHDGGRKGKEPKLREEEEKKKEGVEGEEEEWQTMANGRRMRLVLEENPKWKCVADILDEIDTFYADGSEEVLVSEAEKKTTKKATKEPKWAAREEATKNVLRSVERRPTLILVSDDRAAAQLRDFLTLGGRAMLRRRFLRLCEWQKDLRALSASVLLPASKGKTLTPATLTKMAPHERAEAMRKAGMRPSQGIRDRRKRRREEQEAVAMITADAATGANDDEEDALTKFLGDESMVYREMLDRTEAQSPTKTKTGEAVSAKRTTTTTITTSSATSSTATTASIATSAASTSSTTGKSDDDCAGDRTDVFDHFDEHFSIVNEPFVVIQPIRTASFGPVYMPRVLEDLAPHLVVLYDADLTSLRQLEVFKATRAAGTPLRIYKLYYDQSVEEQRFLTKVRREKDGFTNLIREKEVIAVTHRDGVEEAELLQRTGGGGGGGIGAGASTRIGGTAVGLVNNVMTVVSKRTRVKVVVDMREFRSALPGMLHGQGLSVLPCTLEVGDYILTPQICVERKSVPDLIGSLASGRLFTQCESMCRFYKVPVLLIEFEEGHAFSLQSRREIGSDLSYRNIVSKLALLTLHFPLLRLLWSPSAHATAVLFRELKQKRDEPNVETAVSVGVTRGTGGVGTGAGGGEEFNFQQHDALLAVPGVTRLNARIIMKKVKNIAQLVMLSEKELQAIVENAANGSKMYSFFHNMSRKQQ